MSFPPGTEMFQFPGFASNPYCIQDLIPSYDQPYCCFYGASPRVSAERQAIETQYGRSKVGFPIRKSLDQSSFAAPQGLSQRTTSFIASQRQGIHRMLLRHLIALVIDVRSFVTGS